MPEIGCLVGSSLPVSIWGVSKTYRERSLQSRTFISGRRRLTEGTQRVVKTATVGYVTAEAARSPTSDRQSAQPYNTLVCRLYSVNNMQDVCSANYIDVRQPKVTTREVAAGFQERLCSGAQLHHACWVLLFSHEVLRWACTFQCYAQGQCSCPKVHGLQWHELLQGQQPFRLPDQEVASDEASGPPWFFA